LLAGHFMIGAALACFQFFRLATETLSDTAAFDGRFARTARKTLVKPGQHVRQYADGCRSPFTPPIRYFLLLTFLFFTTLWLTDRHLLVLQIDILDIGGDYDTAEIIEKLSDPNVTDAEIAALQASGELPEAEFYGGFLMKAKDVSYTDEEIAWLRERIAESEFSVNGRDVNDQRLVNAIVSMAQNPAAFNNVLNGWIPRLMILFIPMMALLGTVFVRGKDALIYDHLLLSIQTHAFGFLVLTLSLWTSRFLPSDTGAAAFFLGVPFYYLMGLRGAFRRSWRKSIATAAFVTVVYAVTYSIALLAAGVASFAEIV
ncbi:MAG: DUF3667 domain-containing protein, partial [Pseudomonadota bacterium]